MIADQLEIEAARAQRTAREQLKFILANMQALRLACGESSSQEKAARSFIVSVKQFTPAQLSYIDGIYEKTMKGLGLPSASVHHDQRTRGLRYG